MALIRGLGSHFPCPICLVPDTELSNLFGDYSLRSAELMQDIHDEAQELNQKDGDQLLKAYGLRDVNVCSIPIKHDCVDQVLIPLADIYDLTLECFLKAT